MKGKIIAILLMTLLIAIASLSVSGSLSVTDIEMVKKSIGFNDEGFIVSSRIDWWPMFHHDLERSGYSTSIAPDTNDVLWSKELGWWVLSSPAVVDYKLYVSDATCNFYCLDSTNGNIIWNYLIGSGHGRTPAVVDDRVYFGVGIINSATLFCLNALDGSHIWDFVTNNHNIMSSPAIYEEKVYFGTMGQVEHDLEYYIYCLDAVGNGDGTTDMIWSYQLDDWVQSSPAVIDGKVYIGSHDHNVYCLDPADGSYIWSYTTGDCVRSSPAISDGKIYIGSDDNNVYCLDAADGSYIWSYTTGSGVYSTPAVYNGKIYVGSFDNNVYCLDAADGSYIWSYTASDMVSTSPAVADSKIFVATYDGNFYCLDAIDGDLIWNYMTGDEIWYSPSIANGKVYIGSKDHYVYCFGKDIPVPNLDCSGSLSWTDVKPGKKVTGSFKVSNCGDDGSELNWEVDSYPVWGTGWTFNPTSGTGQTPAQGWVTVQVEVTAPTDQETEFKGNITVINSDNPADFCEVSVYLKTPRDRSINSLFLNFQHYYPNLFQLLKRFFQRLI